MNRLQEKYQNSVKAELQNKKIAVLEIIGLMFADGGYNDEERVVLHAKLIKREKK